MSDEGEKHYSNGEITVVWKPQLCQHIKRCWKELNAVFDPKRRPWIDVTKAPSAHIVEQVKACPSGALSLLETT